MRKIKNFNIHLRVKEIIRVVTKLVSNEYLTDDIDIAVQRCCKHYTKFIVPSVVYDTFLKEKEPTIFTSQKDVPQKYVAQTIFFITIGDNILQELQKNERAFGVHTTHMVNSIAVDALEQSKNFLSRIVTKSEASEESCGISRSIEVDKSNYPRIGKIIPSDKIGITIENEKLKPIFSMCAVFYWVPSKKNK
ncbi:MAG: hypothetical protein LBU55_00875 [Elusimicrobiota bacterium]|jgi:hypothetical protein|nr:hypothetical protein [Elusimicrobiota bacterium]